MYLHKTMCTYSVRRQKISFPEVLAAYIEITICAVLSDCVEVDWKVWHLGTQLAEQCVKRAAHSSHFTHCPPAQMVWGRCSWELMTSGNIDYSVSEILNFHLVEQIICTVSARFVCEKILGTRESMLEFIFVVSTPKKSYKKIRELMRHAKLLR